MWILIAFVAAVGLTALAVMMVFGEFGSASSSQTAQSVLTGVSAIISNILTDYAGNPSFGNLTTGNVIADGAVPNNWLPSGTSSTTIALPGGGAAQIIPASISPGTDNGFEIEMTNLNQATCAQFGTFYTPNVSSVTVNGTTVNNPAYQSSGSGSGSGTTPSWPPALAGECQAAGANSINITVAGQ